MKLFEDFRSFILEDDFSLHVYKNKVSIVNYDNIGHFDTKEVRIYYNKGEILIKGENLVVSKLLQEEILIIGTIKSIEFR